MGVKAGWALSWNFLFSLQNERNAYLRDFEITGFSKKRLYDYCCKKMQTWFKPCSSCQSLERYPRLLDLDFNVTLISGICKHLILSLLLDGGSPIFCFVSFCTFDPVKMHKLPKACCLQCFWKQGDINLQPSDKWEYFTIQWKYSFEYCFKTPKCKKERKVTQGVVEKMGVGWKCGPRGRGYMYAHGWLTSLYSRH